MTFYLEPTPGETMLDLKLQVRAIFTDAQLPGKQLCRESQKYQGESLSPCAALVLDPRRDSTAGS